jgi:hypothetical protein
MQMFNANVITRTLVLTAQITMTPLLMAVYTISPATVHR